MRTIALTLLAFGALSCSAQPSAVLVESKGKSERAPISAAQALERCESQEFGRKLTIFGEPHRDQSCLVEQANLARSGGILANLATSPKLSPAIEICVAALRATLCTSKCPVMVLDNQGHCAIEMR
jgi:hypothetical protein